MLYFALADIVQTGSPFRIMLKVFGDVLGKQDVPGISAIHHPLRDVDPGPGNVRALIDIGDFVYRPAVNAHSNPKFWMVLKRLTNLQSATNWLFRAVAKHQRHPITCR